MPGKRGVRVAIEGEVRLRCRGGARCHWPHFWRRCFFVTVSSQQGAECDQFYRGIVWPRGLSDAGRVWLLATSRPTRRKTKALFVAAVRGRRRNRHRQNQLDRPLFGGAQPCKLPLALGQGSSAHQPVWPRVGPLRGIQRIRCGVRRRIKTSHPRAAPSRLTGVALSEISSARATPGSAQCREQERPCRRVWRRYPPPGGATSPWA